MFAYINGGLKICVFSLYQSWQSATLHFKNVLLHDL